MAEDGPIVDYNIFRLELALASAFFGCWSGFLWSAWEKRKFSPTHWINKVNSSNGFTLGRHVYSAIIESTIMPLLFFVDPSPIDISRFDWMYREPPSNTCLRREQLIVYALIFNMCKDTSPVPAKIDPSLVIHHVVCLLIAFFALFYPGCGVGAVAVYIMIFEIGSAGLNLWAVADEALDDRCGAIVEVIGQTLFIVGNCFGVAGGLFLIEIRYFPSIYYEDLRPPPFTPFLIAFAFLLSISRQMLTARDYWNWSACRVRAVVATVILVGTALAKSYTSYVREAHNSVHWADTFAVEEIQNTNASSQAQVACAMVLVVSVAACARSMRSHRNLARTRAMTETLQMEELALDSALLSLS